MASGHVRCLLAIKRQSYWVANEFHIMNFSEVRSVSQISAPFVVTVGPSGGAVLGVGLRALAC
jgi:hypothetical protein